MENKRDEILKLANSAEQKAGHVIDPRIAAGWREIAAAWREMAERIPED